MANSDNLFLPQNVVDVGGAQDTSPPIDAIGGIKLGEVSFGVRGPMMGNAGIITLTSTVPQTGVRDENFGVGDRFPSKVLAVIYVPEPALPLLLLVGLWTIRRVTA